MNHNQNKKEVLKDLAIKISALAFALLAVLFVSAVSYVWNNSYAVCDDINHTFINTLSSSFFLKFN